MDIKELLSRLSADTFCGRGSAASTTVLREVGKFSPSAYEDALGNIIAPVWEAPEGAPHLLLDAHIDEIGFIVTGTDKNGFLKVEKVGGPDLRVLPGQEVTVHGRQELFGVFSSVPPHLSGNGEKKTCGLDKLTIDIGLGKDEVEKAVSPGDFVTLRQRPVFLGKNLINGKSLDDRSGCAAVILALRMLSGENPGCGLTAVFSSGEELGERGARTAAFSVSPTHAIIIDTSFAMTPDAPRSKCGYLGRGPMIGISPILSDGVTKKLFGLAEGAGIPHQTEVMGGGTGTNADVISVSRGGVRCGMLSIPLRYMHTASETVCIPDVENTARLTAEYVMYLGGGKL